LGLACASCILPEVCASLNVQACAADIAPTVSTAAVVSLANDTRMVDPFRCASFASKRGPAQCVPARMLFLCGARVCAFCAAREFAFLEL
jgi:hypothetical protein